MTKLHMQTDSVRAMAGAMTEMAEMLREQAARLSQAAYSVDWMGPNRDQFAAEMDQLVQAINTQAEAGVILSQRIVKEAEEWEQMSAAASASYAALPINDGFQLGPIFGGIVGGIGKVIGAVQDKVEEVRDEIHQRLTMQKQVEWAFNDLKQTEAGRDLLKDAEAAHIRFVFRRYHADGSVEEVFVGGDPNGKVVPIEAGATQGSVSNALGYYTSDADDNASTEDQMIVISNDLGERHGLLGPDNSDPNFLKGVLAHEMQHAVDRNTDLRSEPWDDNYYNDPQQLEAYCERDITNALTTESRAWPRGEAVSSGQPYNDDGVLSVSEARDIMENKGYEANYESQLNEGFAKNGQPYRADVYLDDQGKVQVEIVKIPTPEPAPTPAKSA